MAKQTLYIKTLPLWVDSWEHDFENYLKAQTQTHPAYRHRQVQNGKYSIRHVKLMFTPMSLRQVTELEHSTLPGDTLCWRIEGGCIVCSTEWTSVLLAEQPWP